MKIIEPSSEIIEDELAQLSIYQRIAYCAGVCYQREPNKTEEEAQAFCKKMVSIGHHSTLEMAVVHLVVEDPSYDDSEHWSPRYIQVSPNFVKDNLFVSGSLRAFKEALDGNPEWYGDALESIARSLNTTYPAIFSNDSVHTNLAGSKARSAKPHEIPWQHQHVAVRFIVNRAVSHELVRHRPMSFLQESQRYCRYEDEVVFIRPEWANEYPWDVAFKTDSSHAEGRYKLYLLEGLKPQQARAVLPNSTKTELIAYASLPQWKHIFNLRCSPAADPEMRRVMIPLEQEFKDKYPEAFNA